MNLSLPTNRSFAIACQAAVYLCFAFVCHYLFHLQAYATMGQSDLPQHLSIINEYINTSFYIPHPVFHLSTYYLSRLSGLPIADAAPLVMTVATVLTLFVVHRLLAEKQSLATFFTAVSLLFVIAIYLPFYNPKPYLGQFSPNTWHSQTMLMLRPLALLAFYFFVRFLETSNARWKVYLAASSCFLVASTFTKPSFVIVFLPAVFLYTILGKQPAGRRVHAVSLFAAPSILVLAYQYFRTYQSADTVSYFHDKIIFTFFGVLKLYCPNIIFSALLVLAFPLAVLITIRKRIASNPSLILAWLTTIIAFLQTAFLAEQQKLEEGAFGFGYIISLFLLYFFSMKEVLSWFSQETPGNLWKKLAPIAVIYLLHLSSGIYYFSVLLRGGNYY